MAGKTGTKTIAQNKKAYHDYFVEESLEAGIELVGTEVKSLRQGRANLKDAKRAQELEAAELHQEAVGGDE